MSVLEKIDAGTFRDWLKTTSVLPTYASDDEFPGLQHNLYKTEVSKVSSLTYDEFFRGYLRQNKPCIIAEPASRVADWSITKTWLNNDGTLNYDFVRSEYGDDQVAVADCAQAEYDAHPKCEQTLADYLQYLKQPHKDETLYLKDYHFRRLHPDKMLYNWPVYFHSDWLNEYCDDKGVDDYKFVYLGPKGSWTSFHADVLRSYSWSANIKGRKHWTLYVPGSEVLLKDQLGNLPMDVNQPVYKELSHPAYTYRVEVVQEAGEIIFVPSGWHHQVTNLEETLSVNHNWFNGCNVERSWEYLKQSLEKVKAEIWDCRDMDNWAAHCQVVLKAYLGFNYASFAEILLQVATNRLNQANIAPVTYHTMFDLVTIKKILCSMLSIQEQHTQCIDNADDIKTILESVSKFIDIHMKELNEDGKDIFSS